MWDEGSSQCESNCQCSRLITDNFKINSGNNATKRRHEEAVAKNFKFKMRPHPLDFADASPKSSSPKSFSSRRVLADISNSPLATALKHSPQLERTFSNINLISPITTKRNAAKISQIFEERKKFKIDRTEESFHLTADEEEQEYDVSSPVKPAITNWTLAKISSTPTLDTPTKHDSTSRDSGYGNSTEKPAHGALEMESLSFQNTFVPETTDFDADDNLESLHDLETELLSDNFDHCTKYEIISTDSPNIISRGSSLKITANNFNFGASLAATEPSTSFNKPLNRILNFDDSPVRSKQLIKKSLKFSDSPSKPTTKTSLRSTQSTESGFVSEFEETLDIDEASTSPKIQNFTNLISGTIKTDFKRSVSHTSRAKTLFTPILESPGEKRSLELEEDELQSKRKKPSPRPVLQRAFSENAVGVMTAMARSSLEPDLIGDFTLPFALPLTAGRHRDLKSISCHTLANLLRGEYKDSIAGYQVIDCRYPYEYEGGHITGAQNMYTPEQILSLMRQPVAPSGLKRNILVFHCEFSLERGPRLSRFLRSSDRAHNQENYPSLHYPEVYLLHDGYKSFYNAHPELCTPSGYTAMLDPRHRGNLKDFRSGGLKRYHSADGKKRLMW